MQAWRKSWILATIPAGLALAGCPHDVDLENTELVGTWKAQDLGCLIGPVRKGYATLQFLDARRVKLGDGRTVNYMRPEPRELVIEDNDAPSDIVYNIYEKALHLIVRDTFTGPEKDCLYQRR